MYAKTVLYDREQEDEFAIANDQTIEVVGFVHHDRTTWALWRDDYGFLHEIPVWTLRVQPSMEKVA